MMNTGWFFKPSNQPPSSKLGQRLAGGIGVAFLLLMTVGATAQVPAATAPAPGSEVSAPEGYSLHQSVDLGGHMVTRSGSNAMYDTLVNIQSGPRVLGQTFELRSLAGNKHAVIDHLKAMTTGFGGDPNNFTKMDFSTGKLYDFSGLFRRDRQYFDYDLLGNPNIASGSSMPLGPSKAPLGQIAWPQVNVSPEMFNTVRRMTDVNLTMLPISKVSYRFGYSQNIFEGPSMSPGYVTSAAKYDELLEQYQRNGTDEYRFGLDWKAAKATKLSFDETVNHYKMDSAFMLAPNGATAQEADGTKVYLGNWDSQVPYGIGGCNTTSMGSAYTSATAYTIFTPSPTPGGLPVINPACDVMTSYSRTQPTRILTPTEGLRLQSSSIKNVTMNGDFRYTLAVSNLPNYNETSTGLDGTALSFAFSGTAKMHRAVVSGDYALLWQASKKVTIADQVNYANVHEQGKAYLPLGTSMNTPTDTKTSFGFETINYSGPLTAKSASLPHGNTGSPAYNFFGQRQVTNNLTASWDATATTRIALTYRFKTNLIAQGLPNNVPIPYGSLSDPVSGYVSIDENGLILNAAVRPSSKFDINGTVELLYDDTAFTAVSPRQTKHYRLHAKFRPTPWATLTGAFNDLEKHNNSNANAEIGNVYAGPLNHVESSKVASVGAVIAPNEHYGLDLNYAFTDVFSATNICYNNGATATLPGAASVNSVTGAPNLCPSLATAWLGRDFEEAPTQYVSAAVTLSPNKSLHSNLGYRLSDVSGHEFFNDARAVNGSMNSAYSTPFVNVAWTLHPGLIWKGEYNYNSYTEGGVSGAQYCSTSTSATASVVPCGSLGFPVGVTETNAGATLPRGFKSNNFTLTLHYEF